MYPKYELSLGRGQWNKLMTFLGGMKWGLVGPNEIVAIIKLSE